MSVLNKAFTLRVLSRITGRKLMEGASAEISGGDVPLVGTDKPMQGNDHAQEGQAYVVYSDAGAYADNDDVWRRRFAKHGVTRIRRLFRKISALVKNFFAYLAEFKSKKLSTAEKYMMLTRMRRLLPEEIEQHRQKKTQDALFLFHKQQARLLQVRIIEVLTNLGFCYHITKSDRKYIKQRIRVAHVDISPYAYTYHLTRMPFGVQMTKIAQPEVSTELSASIGKKIRYELDMDGLRFTVEVGSTLSIPNFVGFGDLDDKHPMPKNLPPLAFWAGLTSNGSPVYRNIAEAPHMIIAGSSGGGKSNMENCIACTLIRNNKPERLRVVFFDLKGGVEFDQYKDIPHLFPMKQDKWSTTGIVEYPSDVIPALEVLLKECKHRLDKLKKTSVKNIHEFNRKKRNHSMPYIVVFFDEWAITKKLVGAEAESLLSTIANISRAAGIHFILSTQYPKAEIINTTISVNFPWRIAFNMPSGASQSVLGDWGAVGLTPVGRAVLLTMDGQMQVQTPRITNQNVVDVVEEARTGIPMMGNMQNIDTADVLEWSLNKANMRLDQDSVYNQFKEKINREALREMLRDMENKVFDVEGTLYKVMPSIPPNIGRRMILAEEAGGEAEIAARSPQPAEIEPESAPEAVETVAPHECPKCGGMTKVNPCEYCGGYLENEKAPEPAPKSVEVAPHGCPNCGKISYSQYYCEHCGALQFQKVS